MKSAPASTPKAIADSFIKTHVASLQPQLASILEKLRLQHLDLLHSLYNKETQITRMERIDEFIPRSARIDFKFHMSKNAEERPEFLALQEETNSHIADFRNFLRGQIIKATKIESTTIAENIKIGFVKAIRLCIEAFIIGDDSLPSDLDASSNSHTNISMIMELYHTTLLKHTTFQSLAEFCEYYKKIHNLQSFPISQGLPQSASTSTTPTGSRFFSTSQQSPSTSGANRPPHPIGNSNITVNHLEADKIKRALEAVFITPFDEYTKQCKRNSINLSLKKLSTAHFVEEATNNAAMDLDREPSVDRSQLQDLIRKQTQSENKVLVREISKLHKKLAQLESSKNSKRGPIPPGASPQKQIRKPNQKTTQRQQNLTQKNGKNGTSHPKKNARAEGSDNGSRRRNSRNLNNAGSNRTQRNGRRSKTKNGKS